MDNKKSYIPRLLEKSKEMMGAERLASKISGCILYSGWYQHNRKCLFFINHDQFENGSDMIVTLIFLLIEEFLNDHQKLPRKLHLNLGKSLKSFFLHDHSCYTPTLSPLACRSFFVFFPISRGGRGAKRPSGIL